MVAVYRSTIIKTPIAELWHFLRDFNGHERWHPAIAESYIENGKHADQVGAVRCFKLQDGGELREQLLSLSDYHHSFSYCLLDSPIPLYAYVATVKLKEISDSGHTFWQWLSTFNTPPGREAELAELVGEEIYQAGFAAARQVFSQTIDAKPATRAQRRTPGSALPRPAADTGTLHCQAIVVHQHGGPEQLSWEQVAVAPPQAGQVRIQHTAIGLNFIDIYCRTGYFRLLEPPAIPGMEAAGLVVDVGEQVAHLAPGDHIAYACAPLGAYSEYRTMDSDLLIKLPAAIDDETAAAVMLKGITAEFLLHRVHAVQKNEVILVHAAAGGVGLLLCQWASHLGATVIGTVSTEEKARLAKSFGCAYPIIYTQRDFVADVMEITHGRGADAVFDAVGQTSFMQSYDALAIRGHLVSFGQASGPIKAIDIAAFAEKSARVSRPNYVHYAGTAEQLKAITERLFSAISAGIIRVPATHRYGLSQAADAQRALEARLTTGSTILIPGQ